MSTGPEHDPTVLPELVARLSFEVMGRLARLAAEQEMSMTQLRMLAILRDRRLRMAELALALGTDRSSTSGLVKRAEQAQLVIREPAMDDRRGFTVTLSSAGHQFATAMEERTQLALAPFLNALGSKDQDRLATLLSRVIEQ